MKYDTIGIDVSKHFLDICTLPDRKTAQYPNTPAGFQSFLSFLKKHTFDKIVMEDTGVYHKNLQRFLQKHYTNKHVFVLNPQKIRNYAKSCGVLAKTDKIDAFIIAQYAQRMELVAKIEHSEEGCKLRALLVRRHQLVDHRKKEKNYKESCLDKEILDSITQKIKALSQEIKEIEKKIKLLIKENNFFKEFYNELIKIVGVGEVLITSFLAYVPELGVLNCREIAALIGVAPMNKDSGKKRGKRSVQNGRKEVRDVLFMATRSAINSNEVIRKYFTHLINKGKPYKVAVVACMRKLLIYINSVVEKTFYQKPQT